MPTNINKILAEEISCSKYGAQMGRRDDTGDPDRAYKFHLQRVRFVEGDYDAGGAYWGGGLGVPPLFCAWCEDEKGGRVRTFIRAKHSAEAKNKVLKIYPNATFYK